MVGSRVISREVSTADEGRWWSGCGDWPLTAEQVEDRNRLRAIFDKILRDYVK